MSRLGREWPIGLALLLLFALFLADLCFGDASLSLSQVVGGLSGSARVSHVVSLIVRDYRLPKRRGAR